METERSCGTCTLCCKLLAIADTQSEKNQWCKECRPGHGCSIYKTRPQMCRDFACGWRAGAAPDYMNPLLVRGILVGNAEGTGVTLVVDPTMPEAWQSVPSLSFLQRIASRGMTVVVTDQESVAWHVGKEGFAKIPSENCDFTLERSRFKLSP